MRLTARMPSLRHPPLPLNSTSVRYRNYELQAKQHTSQQYGSLAPVFANRPPHTLRPG